MEVGGIAGQARNDNWEMIAVSYFFMASKILQQCHGKFYSLSPFQNR